MSFIGNHIATVPTGPYKRYLTFREGAFHDGIKEEIDRNFMTLGREAGSSILVVRGYDAAAFRDSVYEAAAFYEDRWAERATFPSLLVTTESPNRVLTDAKILDTSKVMIFPLADIYKVGQVSVSRVS